MKKAKNRAKQFTNESVGESLRGILGGVTKQVAETGKKVVTPDNWDEILGLVDSSEKQKKQTSGDLSEGQVLNLKDLREKSQEKSHAEPGIDYSREIVHAGERVIIKEKREVEEQLREIAIELKKLTDSSSDLRAQFKDVAIEQHVVSPGKYHKSFFSWLLSLIRIARMRVEDSGAWLAAMQSKKKFREYGSMAKKHGTGFTLSNERTVATQVG